MHACHNHEGLVVVMDDKTFKECAAHCCPVCEIIHDNFKMRTQLLTGAKLADYEIGHLPKYI